MTSLLGTGKPLTFFYSVPQAARREAGTYRRQPGGKEVPYHSKNVEGEEARDGHEVF
jgi:hypothetical protein